MRRPLAAAVIGGALALLTACSTPSNTPSNYDAQTKDNFVVACTQSTGDPDSFDVEDLTTDTTVTVSVADCECRYEYFVENVPFDGDQRDSNPDFADYNGPTFVDLNNDAGDEEPLPADILSDLSRECGDGAPAEPDDAGTDSTDDTGSTTTEG